MSDVAQRRTKKKKRSGGAIIIVVLLVLLIGAAAFMLLSNPNDNRTEVEVQKVENRTIMQTVTATGTIDPELQVIVSSEVSGEIVFIGVDEGDTVTKGQVIVRINPESIRAQLEQADAAILGARSRVSSSQASLLRAEQALKRVQALFAKQLATSEELETAQSQVSVAKAELESSEYQVQQSQANSKQVRESLNKTTIVAPISGIVTKLKSKVGEKVVGAIQMTGTEIMTIADLSVIEAVVEVVETDVIQISDGDEAEVEVDAFPDEKFRAVVSKIANSPTTTGTGTQEQLTNFQVRVRFVNPDPRFRPGMTATATIETDKQENVASVPIQSVTTRQNYEGKEGTGGNAPEKNAEGKEGPGGLADKRGEQSTEKSKPKPVVFVLQGDSVMQRPVKTGIRNDQYIQILEGLKLDEEIVSGTYKVITKDLQNGMKVKKALKERSGPGKRGAPGKRPE